MRDDSQTAEEAQVTYGSLFSGIGLLDLGVEMATGARCVWQAESDAYARSELAARWPNVRRYEDVRDIDAKAERPDIICGGFPCQDISSAGPRTGLDGERSGLWAEFARILRDIRPDGAFVENVAALTVRGLGDVLADLAALGFDAEWGVLSACAVGAPHTRDRLFCLAYADQELVKRWVRARADRERSQVQRGHEKAMSAGVWLATNDDIRSMADGSWDAKQVAALGNGVVPQQACRAFELLAARTIASA